MFCLDRHLLYDLTSRAYQASRRRQHYNIHQCHSEPCQRLINAIQPESYIPPHRHTKCGKPELLIAVQGLFSLIYFDENGVPINAHRFGTESFLSESCSSFGLEVPPGNWHTVISLVPNSVLLEVKEGPYEAHLAKEVAPWAPPIDSMAADCFVSNMRIFSQGC